MTLDKLLLQFLVVLAAVVLGLYLYDRLLKPATPLAGGPAVIAASQAAERDLVDRAGLRNEVVTAIASLRVALAEHYLSRGQWPTTLDEIGMRADHEWRYLRPVMLLGDGVIRIDRLPVAGGGSTWLTPKAHPDNGTIHWTCRSDWPDAALVVPGCP